MNQIASTSISYFFRIHKAAQLRFSSEKCLLCRIGDAETVRKRRLTFSSPGILLFFLVVSLKAMISSAEKIRR